jgi:adenylate cyclase
VVFREIDRIRVKGKDEAVTIHEPLDLAGDEVELRLWEQALGDYRARRWDGAGMMLRELHRMRPGSGLYSLYMERTERLRREPPPPGWDGVTVFDEK